jgi:hypothetical protein
VADTAEDLIAWLATETGHRWIERTHQRAIRHDIDVQRYGLSGMFADLLLLPDDDDYMECPASWPSPLAGHNLDIPPDGRGR